MKILKKTVLTKAEQGAVMDLINLCHQEDQTVSLPYLSNSYNFDKSMPCFFLLYEGESLFAFLHLYADEPQEAYLSLYVVPSHRRQGLATRLLEEFKQLAEDYQLMQVIYCSEKSFLAKNPWFLGKYSLKEKDRAIWLRRDSQSYLLEPFSGLEVVRATENMISAIASLQAAAFGNSLEISEQYARASLEGEGSFLYVLKKEGLVVASVTVDRTSDYNHVFGLAVAPDYQRQGLATYLMKSVINQVSSQSEKKWQIVVDSENKGAAALYRGLGFEEVTEVLYLEKE